MLQPAPARPIADAPSDRAVACERRITAILDGAMPERDTAAYLTDLARRGESDEEILGCVRAMLRRIEPIEPSAFGLPADVIDIGGTGGDGLGLFNISTTAALVAAAAGVPVLKHGNRGFSSPSGSADMIEALGVRLADRRDDRHLRACLREVGFAYLYTPVHHRFPAGLNRLRRRLGIRTIFNLAGPIAHPARLKKQMIGVAQHALLSPFASILREIGRQEALIFHGADGADEISLSGPTWIRRVDGPTTLALVVTPEDFGIERAPLAAIRGGDARDNAEICLRILAGRPGPHLDAVLLTAAAALTLSGKAAGLYEGAARAREVIETGQAMALLHRLREVSHDCAG